MTINNIIVYFKDYFKGMRYSLSYFLFPLSSLVFPLSTLLLLTSCEKDIEIDYHSVPSLYVVEA